MSGVEIGSLFREPGRSKTNNGGALNGCLHELIRNAWLRGARDECKKMMVEQRQPLVTPGMDPDGLFGRRRAKANTAIQVNTATHCSELNV
jgi:hypothetical protein